MRRRAIELFMADIATAPAKYGDTDGVLWLKIAVAAQSLAGITPGNDGDMLTGTPRYGDTQGNMLKAAHALQNAP